MRVCEGLGVKDRVTVSDGVCDGETVGVPEFVGVNDADSDAVAVLLGVVVHEGVKVGEPVGVGVTLSIALGVALRVASGDGVMLCVDE